MQLLWAKNLVVQMGEWYIDGLDGTTNLTRGIPICDFTMAKADGKEVSTAVVFDFIQGNMYYAIRGEGAYVNGKRISPVNRAFEESVIEFDPLHSTNKTPGEERKKEVDAVWEAMREITFESGRFHRKLCAEPLSLAWVAEGRLDGHVSSWTYPWDAAAGSLIAKEAGKVVSDLRGKPWEPSYDGIVVASPDVHEKLIRIIGKIF